MSADPVRFIHAADMRLELPISGVGSVPQALASTLVDAPFVAARRVFEAARNERVDFVVLSGGILHPLECGPAALVFLLEQLGMLADANIPVYWAGSRIERFHQWPKAAVLPGTVYRSPARDIRSQVFYRAGEASCLLHVSGYQGRRAIDGSIFREAGSDGIEVAVAHGDLLPGSTEGQGIAYWAMGGGSGASTREGAGTVVHYPGSPQGRAPSDTGVHGCTLVEISAEGGVELEAIACDAVQWQQREIRLVASTSRRSLERQLVELTRDLVNQEHHQPQLLEWRLTGMDVPGWCGPLLAEELREMLRVRFEATAEQVWITDVVAEQADSYPVPVIEPDTIAADFFELLGSLRDEASWPDILAREMETQPMMAEALAELLPKNRQEREGVLRQVAHLGMDLLGAHRSRAEEQAEESQSLREAS